MANFDETMQKLGVYGEVPLTVVFVGVGRADFTSVTSLCRSENNPHATRRNATFVEFRQHQHDPKSLAQAALQDVPIHISEYLAQKGIGMPASKR
jgi:hypothetical protein